MSALSRITALWPMKHTRRNRKLIFITIVGILLIALYLQPIDKPKLLAMAPRSGTDDAAQAMDNNTLVAQLEREVRLICWVMTTPKHKARALAVKNTWGKRCNRLIFVTPQHDEELGETIITDTVKDAHETLWYKVLQAFEVIYSKYFDEADWFLKIDDDGYVFVENLRYFLYAYSPETPIYFGHNFKFPKNITYMSGGCGYVLSKKSLQLFVKVALQNTTLCAFDNPMAVEDVEISVCLHNVGVFPGDSRDKHNKWRFFPFTPHYGLVSNYMSSDFWFYHRTYYQPHMHSDCFSPYAISFHYISVEEMYMFEYLNYEFQLHNDAEEEYEESLPKKINELDLAAAPSDNERDVIY